MVVLRVFLLNTVFAELVEVVPSPVQADLVPLPGEPVSVDNLETERGKMNTYLKCSWGDLVMAFELFKYLQEEV